MPPQSLPRTSFGGTGESHRYNRYVDIETYWDQQKEPLPYNTGKYETTCTLNPHMMSGVHYGPVDPHRNETTPMMTLENPFTEVLYRERLFRLPASISILEAPPKMDVNLQQWSEV